MPSLVEIGPVVLEKKNSLFRLFFFTFERGMALQFHKLELFFYLSARIQIEEVLNLVHCSIIAVNVRFALVHGVLGTTGIFNDVHKHNL